MSRARDALRAAEAVLADAEAAELALEVAAKPAATEATSLFLGHIGEPRVKGKDY